MCVLVFTARDAAPLQLPVATNRQLDSAEAINHANTRLPGWQRLRVETCLAGTCVNVSELKELLS